MLGVSEMVPFFYVRKLKEHALLLEVNNVWLCHTYYRGPDIIRHLHRREFTFTKK